MVIFALNSSLTLDIDNTPLLATKDIQELLETSCCNEQRNPIVSFSKINTS